MSIAIFCKEISRGESARVRPGGSTPRRVTGGTHGDPHRPPLAPSVLFPVTITVQEPMDIAQRTLPMTHPAPEFHDRMLSLGLARVSEAAAIACTDLIGRGDEKAADQGRR